MKIVLVRMFVTVVLVGLCSQAAMADNASSATEIAGIVVSMNHFASDADKAKLMAIAADDSLAEGLRAMATAVANITHAATAEGKAAMAALQDTQMPDRGKTLASVIAGFNHMASAEDKARITELYGL